MRRRRFAALAIWVGLSACGCGSSSSAPSADPTFAGVGNAAADYLKNSPYDSLVIEVDAAPGLTVDTDAINLLQQRIEERCNKTGGVSQDLTEILPAGEIKGEYSAEDLVALRAAHFDNPSSGTQAGLYVLYLNGTFKDNPDAIGVAFAADAYAFFREKLDQFFPFPPFPPGIRKAVEKAAHVHELGHLLGLVNITTPMVMGHEDPDSPGHDISSECVMYWEVGGGFLDTPPNDFRGCCQEDLDAAGGKAATDTACPP